MNRKSTPAMTVRAIFWLLAFGSALLPAIPAEGATAAPASGQAIYARHCAHCHGANLEGQPNWRIRAADGKLPAPPHDETGHTWHHPDRVLFEIVKSGLVPPHAPPGYASNMPAFGEVLTDDEIRAVLAYIKSRWPPDARAWQTEINARAGGSKR